MISLLCLCWTALSLVYVARKLTREFKNLLVSLMAVSRVQTIPFNIKHKLGVFFEGLVQVLRER